jgi:ribosomal protein S18 acetylase RimI-like enzyme
MAEMKNIRVRDAKVRDIGLFRSLWSRCINELKDKDKFPSSSVKDSMEFFENLFNLYTESSDGFVLFVADKGVLVAGKAEAEKDTAQIFGVYVAPNDKSQEISKALLGEAKSRLEENKYSVVTLAILPFSDEVTLAANELGFKPFIEHYLLSLDRVNRKSE